MRLLGCLTLCSKKMLEMSKVAVITGSSGGIGRALVRTYLDDGYFVIGLDRQSSAQLITESYSEITVNLLMFSKEASYRDKCLNEIKGKLPKRIKKLVVINNAAEQIIKSVPKIVWEDWESSLAINTLAPFFLVQGLLEELKRSFGHVVNISSIHAKLTKAQFTCYAVSKAALDGLTRSLALELSPKGISVNAVAPAAISTEMLKAGFKGQPEKLIELEACHPSGTIGSPEQVSLFVKAITDQEGGFITGAILDVNGGISGRLYDPG